MMGEMEALVESAAGQDGGATLAETTIVIDDPECWAAIAPGLKICDPASIAAFQPIDVDPATGEALNGLLRTEGYFQLDPLDWDLPLPEMAQAVGRMRELGLSECFAFIYDEFWLAFAKLQPMLEIVMGGEYRAIPAFWAWYIDPQSDGAGWRPHRDMTTGGVRPDGVPKAVSVWLPLTDATTLNGCIYCIPADRDPGYLDGSEFDVQMGDLRALPAKAGSVLCWSQALMHWGSHSVRRAPAPRVSIAFEFQRGDEPPFRTPQLLPGAFPSFEERLALIAMQIMFYAHMYDVPKEMTTLAQSILDITTAIGPA